MKSALLALGLVLGVSSVSAANWPQFRGPDFNGSSSEKNLPSQWSKTEKIAWAVDMPGTGAATPVIWNDHVFVSTIDKTTKSTMAMALDRKTGNVLWQHTVAPGDARDDKSNYAAPSPATDGNLMILQARNCGNAICRRNMVTSPFNGRSRPVPCSSRASFTYRFCNGMYP
ncbi:MAG: outer rane biosis protein BamB [Verrucomicrobia bacterium]|nr:outer rane biosis protein BamB [Verrucomicrobiota bacterium]